jgi:hypothetical protein
VKALIAVLVLVAATGIWPAPAAAAGCSTPKGTYAGQTPWAQKLIDPARIWPLTTGSGVTVAVISTGVDPANAQFAQGAVLPAIDLIPSAAPDCDGRGTFAAGIIAAQSNPATTFAGIAPGARILPIRYTQSTTDTVNQGGAPDALATGINRAVAASAKVILVGVPAFSDSGALDAAVANALTAGDVVVSPAAAPQAGVLSYPTASPGVLAVGAVNESGGAVQTESGSYVALGGPGANLVSTSAGAGGKLGHAWPVQDPSFAAAYVAGAAALLRSYRPDLSPSQIAARLTLTASRPAGGGHDGHIGWGVVDAYAAVSATLPADVAGPGAPPVVAPRSVAAAARSAGVASPYRWAGIAAVLAVLAAIAIAVGAVTMRRGRARGWRLGRVRVPTK